MFTVVLYKVPKIHVYRSKVNRSNTLVKVKATHINATRVNVLKHPKSFLAKIELCKSEEM